MKRSQKQQQPKKSGGLFAALNTATAKVKPKEQAKQSVPPDIAIAQFQAPIEWFAAQVALMNHGNVAPPTEPAKQIFNISGGGVKPKEEDPVQLGEATIEEPPAQELPVDPIEQTRLRLKGGKK